MLVFCLVSNVLLQLLDMPSLCWVFVGVLFRFFVVFPCFGLVRYDFIILHVRCMLGVDPCECFLLVFVDCTCRASVLVGWTVFAVPFL